MPRVSIRRFCLYALYTLVGASLVMLAFHVQQQNQIWMRITPEQSDTVSNTDKSGQETNDLTGSGEHVSSVAQDDNVTSLLRQQGLPWYMKSDGYRPQSGQPLVDPVNLWPDHNQGDRIEEQLMISPPESSAAIITDGETTQAQEDSLKKIYLPNGLGSWQVKAGRELFIEQKCPVDRCTLTGHRDDAATADAIMFKDYFSSPSHKRPANQLWIMYMLECPLHTQFIREKGAFNWTATYRHDSELVTPYEKWVYYDAKVRRKPVVTNFAANKTKKVAWFVSNCGAKNKRLEYAHTLQKYIDVDIYGNCGTKSCPRHSDNHCFDVLSRDYKFYLAFENSNCRDYITEKFYVNGLGSNVLPVVMGAPRADYEKHAPEHSFIHVDDFATAKEMADFLHVLDKNDTLYNEYFEWKETGQFINTYFFCRLCAMLHQVSTSPARSYPDFNQWWKGGFTCIRGSWRDFDGYQKIKKKKKSDTSTLFKFH